MTWDDVPVWAWVALSVVYCVIGFLVGAFAVAKRMRSHGRSSPDSSDWDAMWVGAFWPVVAATAVMFLLFMSLSRLSHKTVGAAYGMMERWS